MSDLLLIDGFHATPQRFLWHPAIGTAILSDLHLGIEAVMAAQGMSLPPMGMPALRKAWRAMADRLRTSTSGRRVVIAGDFFDAPAPDQAAILLARELLSELPPATALTFVRGNHDPSPATLAEILDGLNMDIQDSAEVGGYNVLHGHSSLASASSGLIVGHQHPSVVLSTRVQSAKMICYAVCTVRSGKKKMPMVLLPTFSRAPLGSNLLTERHWLLDLPRPANQDIRIAGIVERGDDGQVLDFGTLADL
jgi:putative SbcD/Mre11-related phosphoesterase